ncbi:MAG: hypothetical protein GW839_01600 [Flavobacteriales bacterium]|nr:hypothetical protein [Flavobacteriia bacterium]NCP04800.1 hypothetical protein [Flavobacteriales bacterium]PIV92685.1 MAG: hypothetical protein COW44_14005 [Flavobacteriaceae bacterium CG17_big_fil_post_rev_8_21_14_2_50_33_15]PIY11147.1 MAG: hypothetical protein COZ17_07940 [Flavobacteriaceae bacterium CG_4_10_14_3_um_filter_33_47]PJB17832.1 MAG: hypothetical protein CO117_10305 [Flavobacteriaceae bacterium CG_4_9_14_3_um_filter_33_16]
MKKLKLHKEDLSRLHKDKLGMDIPEDFFAKSKENILNKVIEPETPKQTVFWLRPIIAYPIAASIILAIAITFWMKNNPSEIKNQMSNTEAIKLISPDLLESDFLIASLMVSDSEMNDYLDRYLIKNVVIEAELSEQQLENIFINSVLIEDSLINHYLDKSLIENIVL